jgi:hypothetical protein
MTDLSNYYKRTEFPYDGPVVQEMVHNDDGTITILYDDYTFLIVKKVKP